MIVNPVIIIGFNFTIWSLVGLLRWMSEKLPLQKQKTNLHIHSNTNTQQQLIQNTDVAVIMAAHNEELVIKKTLQKLKRVIPAKNIYIGSDGSTDQTTTIAQSLGCNVVDIKPNRGKAGALSYTLSCFNLYDKYKAVLIVDADSDIHPHYLDHALPLLNDPTVAVVAVHAESKWEPHHVPTWSKFFAAYRIRLYRVLHTVFKYGQTWKHINVTPIAPGFSSIYRTTVLKQIEINTPGLVIEDYFMSFQIHYKKLGRIAYSPQATSQSQDPNNLKDYIKQVKRWNLGFWQTVIKHGYWPSLFCLSNIIFISEMMLFNAVFLLTPLLLIWFIINEFQPAVIPMSLIITIPNITATMVSIIAVLLVIRYHKNLQEPTTVPKKIRWLYASFSAFLFALLAVIFYLLWNTVSTSTMHVVITPNITITFLSSFIILFILDYIFTYIVAMYEHKPVLLWYGLGFFLLRLIDSYLFIYTLPLAFIAKSTGSWKSPKRY